MLLEAAGGLLDSVDALVVRLDAGGYVLHVNKAVEQITGYAREELIGKHWFELLVPPSRYPGVWSEFERIAGGGEPGGIENPILTKSGQERVIAWRTSTLTKDGRVAGTLSIGVDFTDHRRRENALMQSEERHRAMFERNPQPMWVYDLEDLRFLDVNAAAVALYGFSREEFLRMTIRDIRPAEDVPALLQNVAETSRGYARSGPWRHRTKQGAQLLVEIASHDLSFNGREARLVLAVDMTARARAEQALRDSESLLRLLFASSVDAVLICTPAGRVLTANPAACAMFGRTEEELRACGRAGAVDQSDPRLAAVIEERSRVGHAKGEVRLFRRDGSVFEAEVTTAAFTDRHGEPRHSVVLRDITARRREEDAAAAQLAELTRWRDATLGRENRVLELKREVNELLAASGKPMRYPSAEAAAGLPSGADMQ